MEPEPKEPLKVRCGVCEHTWIAAYEPIDVPKVIRIMRGMRCPMCAATSRHIYLTSDVKG